MQRNRTIASQGLLHWIHALPQCIQNLLQVAHCVWSDVLSQDAVQVLVLAHEHHQGVFREAPAVGWEYNICSSLRCRKDILKWN